MESLAPALTPNRLNDLIACPSLGFGLKLPGSGFGFADYAFRLKRDTADYASNHFAWTNEADGGRSATASLGDGLRLVVSVQPLDRYAQFLMGFRITNESPAPVSIEGASFGQVNQHGTFTPGEGHVLGWAMRYAHTGNLRTERYPYCAADYPYVRQLPVETKLLGDTEDQPFPGLFIYNEVSREGLVIGFAEQWMSTPVFKLRRKPLFRPDAFEEFEVCWDFPQSQGFDLEPGESLELEPLYVQLTSGTPPAEAFEDYLEYLSSTHRFRGANTPVNSAALHCTWNYGVFADQREATLSGTARFIAENLPDIRYFLIDDGYLEHTPQSTRVYLDRFYPTPADAPISPDSWPQGIRGFANDLMKMGLKPGLWWTPTVLLPCRLHDEHPEWFLRKKNGELYLIGDKLAYLDYSHPEALAFLDRTLAHILGDWGMHACKIDFWSQNFESRDALLHRPNCTGIQMRRLFFETVRKHLPADGVIMSCIAMGMGNPFLGEYLDTYRCSMDITDGHWQDQINSCRWSLPLLGFGGRRGALLNTDSVGLNAELSDNENRFRLTWCYITMGLIETGGRLETLAAEHLAALKKVLQRCDRGYPCRCPDDRAYTGLPLPEILYVNFPADSSTARQGIRQSIAFFNWDDRPKNVSVERSRLGHPQRISATDFWNGQEEIWDGDFVSITLPPRSARLFDIA